MPAIEQAPALKTRGLYVNTMVFAIVAGIVSLALLLVLVYVPEVRAYAYLIATVEIGLIAVILYALVNIFSYESALRKKNTQSSSYLVSIDTCPDYFSNVYNSTSAPSASPSAASAATSSSTPDMGGVVCRNGYPTGDGEATYYFVKKGCSGTQLSDSSCNLNTRDASEFRVPLNSFSKVDAKEVCTQVNTTNATSAYASVPWTDVKARCTSLSFGSN
jgi:hypothetical protein